MRSIEDIRSEVRYWEGVLEWLKATNKDLSVISDTIEKKAVQALASATILRWVLSETKKEG